MSISTAMQRKGFSLMELFIVFAIIGILASIALPSYNESIERAQRTDCNKYLLELASKQARFYTQYASYTGVLKSSVNCSAANCGLNLSTNSNEQETCIVTVNITPGGCGSVTEPFMPCTEFKLLGKLGNDKKCATVGFDHLGQKYATAGQDNILTGDELVDFCWR